MWPSVPVFHPGIARKRFWRLIPAPKLIRRQFKKGEETMIRLIAVAFVLTVATSATAMPVTPLHQTDGMITQVREACGVGQVRINGECKARTDIRQERRENRRGE